MRDAFFGNHMRDDLAKVYRSSDENLAKRYAADAKEAIERARSLRLATERELSFAEFKAKIDGIEDDWGATGSVSSLR